MTSRYSFAKPRGPHVSVQQCADDGEECVIESAMFTIEGDNLFVSNVGTGAPPFLSSSGGGGGGDSAETEEEEAGAAPSATATESLKPEDAAAGGEYVGGDDKEAVAEADAAEALSSAAATAGAPTTVVVDGESLPPLGKTRLDPGALIVLGGSGGNTHIYEVNRTVHAHA